MCPSNDATDDEGEIRLSILDRLTALEPGARYNRRSNPWENLRALKASLCRDLAAILNTRRAEQDFDPVFEQCTNSLLTFGVTDFTAFNLNNQVEQERVRRSIERAIRQFEPRLTRVVVTLDAVDEVRPVLQFRIQALLRTNPAVEPVLFDAALHRDSRRIDVTGGTP